MLTTIIVIAIIIAAIIYVRKSTKGNEPKTQILNPDTTVHHQDPLPPLPDPIENPRTVSIADKSADLQTTKRKYNKKKSTKK